jgi:hypothetical protein
VAWFGTVGYGAEDFSVGGLVAWWLGGLVRVSSHHGESEESARWTLDFRLR